MTGFFAAAPKFAAMALIARLVVGPFGDIITQWQQVIIVLAVLSMFVGAIGALAQTNIKRLMAIPLSRIWAMLSYHSQQVQQLA